MGSIKMFRPSLPFVLLTLTSVLTCTGPGDTHADPWPVVANERGGSIPVWNAVQDLSIGSWEGSQVDAFGDIGAFAVDSTGQVYILDYQRQQISVFDGHGNFLRAISRSGEGPGEMTGGAGLSFAQDGTLWLWDFRNARFTQFTREGEYLKSYRRQATGVLFGWRGGFANDGYLYDFGLEFIDQDASAPYFGRGLRIIPHRLDVTTGETEELESFESPTELTADGMPQPLAGRLSFALTPDGRFLVGNQREYRLWKLTPEDDTLLEFIVEQEDIPLQSADVDSVVSTRWGLERRRMGRDELPERGLAFRRIFVGNSGRIFVAAMDRPEERGRLFDVFTPGGNLLARLRTPVPLGGSPLPQVNGNIIYGVTQDELEVERFVRLRIDNME